MGVYLHYKLATDAEIQSFVANQLNLESFCSLTYNSDRELDLGRGWSEIHFVLEKAHSKSPEIHDAVLGGTYFEIELGMGPPIYVESAKVARLSKLLNETSEDDLSTVYYSDDIGDSIHGINDENSDDILKGLFESLSDLKKIYRTAHEANCGLIKWFI